MTPPDHFFMLVVSTSWVLNFYLNFLTKTISLNFQNKFSHTKYLSPLHHFPTNPNKYWHQLETSMFIFPPRFPSFFNWNSRFCLKKQFANVFYAKNLFEFRFAEKSWVVICDEFCAFCCFFSVFWSRQNLKSDKIPTDNFVREWKKRNNVEKQWRRVQSRRRARIEW